jgi:hypothetical protein
MIQMLFISNSRCCIMDCEYLSQYGYSNHETIL